MGLKKRLRNRTCPRIILVTGGSRSGKSKFAQRLAGSVSKGVVFIATAKAKDPEMRARIDAHRKMRPKHWETIESPLDVAKTVSSLDGKCRVILIDCLTFFVTNLFLKGVTERKIELECERLLKAIKRSNKKAILVTNELGMGIVPDKPIPRRFRDIHGRVNQLAAASSDEVYFMVSGLPLRVK